MTKVRDKRRISRVTVEELLDEMHRTVDGLGKDGASRADLKLLSRAMKELRHAFRFFRFRLKILSGEQENRLPS